MTFVEIAQELTRRGIKYIDTSTWPSRAVRTILTHPKYVGCHVYGRYTPRLYTLPKPKPRAEWVITPGAFEPVVDPAIFEQAQQIIRRFTWNRSDQEILDSLRGILAKHGKITIDLLQRDPAAPSAPTYRA